MFSFFKRNKAKVQIPEWADFFTPAEYENFLAQIDKYFKKEKISYVINDGMADASSDRFGGYQIGLLNLAQRCKQAAPSAWNEIIHEQFVQMEELAAFDKKFIEQSTDFSFAKEYIGVKLYHVDYYKENMENVAIVRHLTEDIVAMLVFDLPHCIKNVARRDFDAWNKTEDEIFTLGLKNIEEKYHPDIIMQKIGDIQCWLADGEHFYAPNIVLDLANFSLVIGAYGTLVAVPNRHAAFLYPIEDLEVVTACNTLIPVIYNIHHEGPGSISNSLYWYRNGRFIKIPCEIDDETLRMVPPEEFVEMLNKLEEKK